MVTKEIDGCEESEGMVADTEEEYGQSADSPMNSDDAQRDFSETECESSDSDESTESSHTRLPLSARIASLLFVSVKPLTVEQLSEASGAKLERVEHALEELLELFSDQVHGFSLKQAAGSWQFRTAPEAAHYIHRLVPKTARKLTKAASETLAIIAYKQPVQRAEIEAIRGVDALPTLKTLIDAKLIRIVGREQAAGQPALYGTTRTFLEKFGINDLSELPSAKELAQLLDEPGEVEDKNPEIDDLFYSNKSYQDEESQSMEIISTNNSSSDEEPITPVSETATSADHVKH